MKKFWHKISVILIFCVMIYLIGGCAAQKKALPPGPDPVPPDRVPRMNVKPSPQKSSNIGADLSKIAEKVDGVRKAYTVILGNVAMVGIDIDNTANSDRTEKLEKEVKNKIERDSRVVKAYVSTDFAIISRIRKIADDVEKGRPITNYLDEIRDIIKKIE